MCTLHCSLSHSVKGRNLTEGREKGEGREGGGVYETSMDLVAPLRVHNNLTINFNKEDISEICHGTIVIKSGASDWNVRLIQSEVGLSTFGGKGELSFCIT